jgi:hypothetical protein
MNAGDLVEKYGKALKGRIVMTEPMGEYPGGKAKITEVGHDKNATEISFMVKSYSWKDEEGNNEIGVFEYENVRLLPKKRKLK